MWHFYLNFLFQANWTKNKEMRAENQKTHHLFGNSTAQLQSEFDSSFCQDEKHHLISKRFIRLNSS
jgi:hypothetical protein